MNRQTSLRVTQRNEGLLQRIRALKAEHPFWGYRRIWAYLHFVEKLPVNKKRLLRLMRAHHLLVVRSKNLSSLHFRFTDVASPPLPRA
jgi:putative transposase